MAQATASSTAVPGKNALPFEISAPADISRQTIQVCSVCARQLVPAISLPPADIAMGPVSQAPQLTGTTTTTTSITSTSIPTTTTGTTIAATASVGAAFEVDPPAPVNCAQALIAALRNNDQKAFEQAFKKSKIAADQEAKGLRKPKHMPLILAQKLNTVCVVDEVLVKRSMTPLMAAASKNNLHSLRLLLGAGADPNISTEDYGTALMQAKTASCIRALLSAGASPDIESRFFGTALIKAVHEQMNEEVLRALIEGKARVNQMAFSAQLATVLEHIVIFRERGEAIWERKFDAHKSSALMAAACRGNIAHVRLLLEAGTDLELKGGPKGYTALMMAVAARQPEAVQALLQAKADVNAIAEDGATPLYLASSKGDCEIMQTLIDAGAVVDQEDDKHMTALMYVVYENDIVLNGLTPERLKLVVDLLMKNGANPYKNSEQSDKGYARYRAQRAIDKQLGQN